jgi:hypothetical protein
MTDLHANRSDLLAEDETADELVAAHVEQVERGPLGIQQISRFRQNELEQIIEIECAAQSFSDVA